MSRPEPQSQTQGAQKRSAGEAAQRRLRKRTP